MNTVTKNELPERSNYDRRNSEFSERRQGSNEIADAMFDQYGFEDERKKPVRRIFNERRLVKPECFVVRQ
ncbi:MAG: hypothetical protein HON65_00965 [Rhodospirillales bacterium]|jgi:hypothetical protein|nr:hypothetical protein [Rhodospirillales bacterium]